jgi:HSP20 family protein
MLWNVDLWGEMDRLRRERNNLFSDFGQSIGTRTYPLVNVYDDKDTVIVTAELPGMTKDKVHITYANRALTLAGRLEPLASTKNLNAVRLERSIGDFEKTVRIPTKINQEKINASFSLGILTVTLPKSEEAKPKTISIEAK